LIDVAKESSNISLDDLVILMGFDNEMKQRGTSVHRLALLLTAAAAAAATTDHQLMHKQRHAFIQRLLQPLLQVVVKAFGDAAATRTAIEDFVSPYNSRITGMGIAKGFPIRC
jgi:hypothetical protein